MSDEQARAPRCTCGVFDLSPHASDSPHPFLRGYDPDCPIHGVNGTNPDKIHPAFRLRKYP